ncbi:hypothetical protein BSKO_09162 [Bryopsis sp. KO-2023]|nr:hypothetical protein BSKO_09162 [Bryopsis sp. KO-2023]
MQISTFALACLLLAAPALAGILKFSSARSIVFDVDTSHAKAQADIKSAVKALSTVKICDPVAVRAASTAVAKALAQVYVEALAKDNSKCGADVVGSSTTKDNVVQIPKVVTPPPTGSGTGSGSTGGSGSAGQVEPCLTIESLDCCFDQTKCGPKGLWAEAPLNPAGNKLVFKRGVSKALCYCY